VEEKKNSVIELNFTAIMETPSLNPALEGSLWANRAQDFRMLA